MPKSTGRRCYSYPLLGGCNVKLDGVERLPLSPIKNRQPATLDKSTKKLPHSSNRNIPYPKLERPRGKSDVYTPTNVETFDNSFFAYERSKLVRRLTEPVDQFTLLPDEMVLKIFKFLTKSALANCASVNHRFHKLVSDESLWKRMDAIGKFLTRQHVDVIFHRSPHYLRLAKAFVNSPSRLPSNFSIPQLTYLDLSMAQLTTSTLTRVLSLCTMLKKCSLEALCITSDVIDTGFMSFVSTIDTLNLTLCCDLNFGSFSKFLANAKMLVSLNIGGIQHNWTQENLTSVLDVLPIGLLSLNIAGFMHQIKDNHILHLVHRTPLLVELDLSDSQEISMEVIRLLVTGLPKIVSLGLSRCYSIPASAYIRLHDSVCLESVQLFSVFNEETLNEIKKRLPHIVFNQQPMSPIARPTFGNRRRTIWGERVRD